MEKIKVTEFAFGKDMNRTIYYKDSEGNGYRRGDDGIIYDDEGDEVDVELEVVKESK